jgi:RNA polymerase sigma-70 factor, ECF subfamily
VGVDESRRVRFDELYRRHAATVAAYALRRASREAAEDVVADTFLVAWRRLDQIPDDALPWLLGVARRTLANDRRSNRRRERLTERLRVELDGVRVVPVDQRLLDALQRLSAGDREVLLLIAWEGLSAGEAADVLGCSAVACRIRLHRARKRLGSALESTSTTTPERVQEAS